MSILQATQINVGGGLWGVLVAAHYSDTPILQTNFAVRYARFSSFVALPRSIFARSLADSPTLSSCGIV
jgi:hypothetical protein